MADSTGGSGRSGRSRLGGGGGGAAPATNPVNSVSALPSGRPAAINGTQMTNADAQQLRDDMDDLYDPDATTAIKLYISDSNPNGDGYSHSQNLNYKLDNGIPLNATEQFIDDNIQSAMHDIGKDTQLVRFCHDDILKQSGIADYTNMTEAQLKQKLIGMELETTSYMSASYDANRSPFAPNQPLGGGREVVLHINTAANTKMVFGARKQTEVVLNKTSHIAYTDLYFDGTTAHPRNSGSKPRIHLFVDMWSE